MIKDVAVTEQAIREECEQMRQEVVMLTSQRTNIDHRIEALNSQIAKWESHLAEEAPKSSRKRKS